MARVKQINWRSPCDIRTPRSWTRTPGGWEIAPDDEIRQWVSTDDGAHFREIDATTTTNQPNGSSRTLLEQAHYAETNQRDFAAAEAGYRQAVEVARAANDTDVEDSFPRSESENSSTCRFSAPGVKLFIVDNK
jgi:hypothetical protein